MVPEQIEASKSHASRTQLEGKQENWKQMKERKLGGAHSTFYESQQKEVFFKTYVRLCWLSFVGMISQACKDLRG